MAAGPVTTRLIEAGAGDQAVVLIHGAASRADRWRYSLTHLAERGWHAYAADLPGHGFATKDPSAPHSSGYYADVLSVLVRSIPTRRLVLVGTSIGAHVAAKMAERMPLDGLALVGATGVVPLGAAATAMASRIADTSEQAVRAKLRRLAVASDGAEELITEEWRINNSPGAPGSLARLAEYMRSEMDRDLADLGPEACGNILLLWGSEDNSVPLQVGYRAHEQWPHARFEVLSGLGHVPFWEGPDAFHRVLDPWLNSAFA